MFLQKNMVISSLFFQLNRNAKIENIIEGIQNIHTDKLKIPQLNGTASKAEKLKRVNSRNPIPYALYLWLFSED